MMMNAPTAQGVKAQAPQVQDPTAPSLVDIIGTLTLLKDKFERFQGQMWASFDTLAE